MLMLEPPLPSAATVGACHCLVQLEHARPTSLSMPARVPDLALGAPSNSECESRLHASTTEGRCVRMKIVVGTSFMPPAASAD